MRIRRRFVLILMFFMGTLTACSDLIYADIIKKSIVADGKLLHAQILDDGTIYIREKIKQVAVIRPLLISEGWGTHFFDVSGKAPDTQVKAYLLNGVWANLKTSIEVVKSGIHVRYSLTPTGSIKIKYAVSLISFFYEDWAGSSYRFGSNGDAIPKIQNPENIDLVQNDAPLSLLRGCLGV